MRDARANVTYLRDALNKTERQLEAITSTSGLADALSTEIQRHDWQKLLYEIGGFLSTWKLKNLHEFITEHGKELGEDVAHLLMVNDPDKKIGMSALILKALDIDEALKTIQNISFMSADAIYKACPDLSRDKACCLTPAIR